MLLRDDNDEVSYDTASEQKALDIIQIMLDLVEVMAEENVSIRDRDTKNLEILLKRKTILSDEYVRLATLIIQDKSFKGRISSVRLSELQEITYRYNKAVALNEARLSGMIQASYDILESMIKQVQEKNGVVKRYGKHAKGEKTYQRSKSVTIDKSL